MLSQISVETCQYPLDLPRRDPLGNSVAFFGKNAMNKPLIKVYDADSPESVRDGKAPDILSGLSATLSLTQP